MADITKCEMCGSYNLKVTDSRNHKGEIWRTRACQDCGNRIYTVEIERINYRKSKEALNAYRTIAGAVKKLEELNGSL